LPATTSGSELKVVAQPGIPKVHGPQHNAHRIIGLRRTKNGASANTQIVNGPAFALAAACCFLLDPKSKVGVGQRGCGKPAIAQRA
jgi:hypothetical protein